MRNVKYTITVVVISIKVEIWNGKLSTWKKGVQTVFTAVKKKKEEQKKEGKEEIRKERMKDGMEEGQKEEAEHKRNRGRVAGREKGMRERKKCRTEPYE